MLWNCWSNRSVRSGQTRHWESLQKGHEEKSLDLVSALFDNEWTGRDERLRLPSFSPAHKQVGTWVNGKPHLVWGVCSAHCRKEGQKFPLTLRPQENGGKTHFAPTNVHWENPRKNGETQWSFPLFSELAGPWGMSRGSWWIIVTPNKLDFKIAKEFRPLLFYFPYTCTIVFVVWDWCQSEFLSVSRR